MRRSTLLAATLLASTASADEVRVSPAWLEVAAAPGTTVETALTVRLDGPGAHQVRVYTGQWSWDDAGRSTYSSMTEGNPLLDIAVDVEPVWLYASEATIVDVVIQIPAHVRSSAYGVVFVEEVVPDDALDEGLRTTSRIAVPVLVDVGSAPAPVVRGIRTATTGRDGPLNITLALGNEGQAHARPHFRGAIRDASGAITTFQGGDRRFLMPGQTRELLVEGPVGLEPGAYELLGVLTLGSAPPVAVEERFIVGEPLAALTSPPR